MNRICACDNFNWEEVPTPILDAVENPLCLKNLSLKVSYKFQNIFIFLLLVLQHCTFELTASHSLNNNLHRNSSNWQMKSVWICLL